MTLSTDDIQSMFGSVFGSIYEDGAIKNYTTGTVRDPDRGTFPQTEGPLEPCKIQRDRCTEAQRSEEGYAPRDVRFLVLQMGFPPIPNTDSVVSYRGQFYKVMSVNQDPARSYWDFRARLIP